MNCEAVLLILNAILDGESSGPSRAAAERHLDECPNCREQFAELQALDGTLKRALCLSAREPVVERVLKTIDRKSNSHHPLQPGEICFPIQNVDFSDHVASKLKPSESFRGPMAVTACLLICAFAVVLGVAFQIPVETPSVAEITLSTGSIDVQRPNTSKWTIVQFPSVVLLPAHVRIRTRDKSLCEIRTKSDAVVRLNRETELVLHDSEQIELVSGELWCRTPSTKVLAISTATTAHQVRSGAIFTCPTSSESQWQATSDQGVQCMGVSSTPIDVAMNSSAANCTISPGETVTFAAGTVPAKSGHADRLEALIWQLPLLLLRSPRDPELKQRLTELLAAAGQSKMAYMYEAQIRQLGSPGTLPLIAFVRSPESREQPALRHRAMRIIADLAPQSSITDLEILLTDDDSHVRDFAARALQRLHPSSVP